MKIVTKTLQVLMVLLLLAFAFQSKAQVTLFTETWESAAVGTTPPAGWAVDAMGYTNYTSFVNGGSNPTCANYEGSRIVKFDSWNASSGTKNKLKMITPISTVGYVNITVDFAMFMQTVFSAGDGLQVQWSTNGTTWNPVGTPFYNLGATQAWLVRSQALPVGAANQPTLYIAYEFISNYGYNVFTDLTHIYGSQLGNLTGTVRNCYTNATMANVPVSCGGVGPVLTNASGVYTLNNINAGPQTITATFAGFTNYTSPVTVVGNTTTTYNFCMAPIPATLAGTITNSANGNPIRGAKIVCNGATTYSIANGTYSLSIYPVTNGTATVTKAGFQSYTSPVQTFTAGVTTPLSVALDETINKPSTPFVAALTPPTTVNLTWGVPSGDYELIYDDGVQELSTVWATQGNMNALKFTALNYPVKVIGGSVNIGKASDYPSGTVASALAPFQVQLYDATGTGGTPGTAIGSPIDVQPTTFGWNAFTIGSINITSGNFYLVMTQGGVPPAAARLGVDNTATQLRSYNKFVTGGGSWLPADGNFMMRLVVNGIGGPLDNVEGILGYRVYRLNQTQEVVGNVAPGTWNQISTPTATNTIDNSWQTIPDGAWRWAVQAKYTGTRWSDFIYSNVLGKNNTANVTVNVTLTCDATPKPGTAVTLTSTVVGVDSVYTGLTDATGKVVFPTVWKGNYNLKVSRFAFTDYLAAVVIDGNKTFDINLLYMKPPPTGMHVDQYSLLSTWNAPVLAVPFFNEGFPNFTANSWTIEANWQLNTGQGQPAPCAFFNWTPSLTNYSKNLTSKSLTGLGSTGMKLSFDYNLGDFLGYSSTEHLAVEISINGGTSWLPLIDIVGGADVPWTTKVVDMTPYSANTFKIRFRAWGADSFGIDWWYVDNVKVIATEDAGACLLGYNVYLNGTLDSPVSPADTSYAIPPTHVSYGQFYHACVEAVYGNGYSTQSCYDFTSKFLYPPTAIQGEALECTAYLTWTKPAVGKKVHVPAFKGTVENTPPDAGPAPINRANIDPLLAEQNTISNSPIGTTAFGFEAVNLKLINFDINNLAGNTTVGPNPLSAFVSGMAAPVGELNWVYATAYGVNNLYKIDKAAGTSTLVGAITGHTGGFNGLAIDPTTGFFYANDATAGSLWKIDPTGPTGTLVGLYNGGVSTMIGITCDLSGNLWGHDVGTDRFFSINKTTGAATAIGALGFNAQYAQCEFFDKATGNVLLGGFNGTNLTGEIRAVDVTTGASVILSSLYYNELTSAYIPFTSGGSDPAGLLGYKIYRDGYYLDYVSGKDTTWYYDYNVNPGMHEYEVSAWYDLHAYGLPVGNYGESLLEGPTDVNIICGRLLPFFEPWTQGSFGFQDWYVKTGSNWKMNTGVGLPAPSADFSWLPAVVDYSDTLVTPVLNASAYNCADIWVDFDLKLVDRNSTDKEKLDVMLFVNGAWSKKADFSNTASFEWAPQHIKISNVVGKAFKVGFRAHGEDSQDILHWYVDNIHVYAVCKPAQNLTGDAQGMDAHLDWSPPKCGGSATGNILNEGFESGVFPPQFFTQIITNTIQTWEQSDPSSILGVHTGNGAGQCWWEYGHQDEWLIAHDILVTGNLSFWANAYLGSTYLDHYYVKVSTDHGTTWTELFDFTNLSGGRQEWVAPYIVDLTAYADQAIDIAWNFVDGDGQGLWYATAIDDLYVGTKKIAIDGLTHVSKSNPEMFAAAKSSGISQEELNRVSKIGVVPSIPFDNTKMGKGVSAVQGYDIYRQDPNGIDFAKVNATLVSDTAYIDPALEAGEYHYYVLSVFSECTQALESDTVAVDIIVGIDPVVNGRFSIYPNPATDLVNVICDYNITSIEVMNYVGQTVYNRQNVEAKTAKINVSGLLSGVYFVKVTTTQGIRTVKITVTH